MILTIDDLRRFADALLRHLEEVKGGEIVLQSEYFWSIPAELAYDVDNVPPSTELTVGQLSECVDFISSMIKDDAILTYGLVWLGQLMIAVGNEAGEG